VSAQAAKALGELKVADAQDALVRALTDTNARVQFFAAQSLGKLGNAASAEPLIALLRANDNKDAYLRFVASYALSKLKADAALAKAAKDPSAAVRLGVLLAYRHSQDPAIATFLNDSDPYIVREAAEAINDAPILALAPLAGKLASAPPADQALVVRAINANYRLGDAPRAQTIANYALNEKATPEMRAERPRGGDLSADGATRGDRRGQRARTRGGEVVR
jgi:HEAT repeat protein